MTHVFIKRSSITLLFTGALVAGFVAASAYASGGETTGRYFVHSNSIVLKAIAGARWNFDDGFTADLTRGQLQSLKRVTDAFNVEVEPVAQYSILVTDGSEKISSKPSRGGGSLTRTAVPSDQTPWGIEKVYNDSSITSTNGGAGVDVAVLDTGVNKNHLDLARRVAQCKDFSGKPATKDGSCNDGNGHGTHVAGTILADGSTDGLGVYGVAPEAKLYAYKVCGNSGFCWSDDIATAIRHAADQGAEVISMSLGSDAESPLVRDAITYATGKGTLIVAAAGNDGPTDGSIDYPGANVNVVAVGAIDSSEQVASWSSRGINDGDYVAEEREVEFGAPGVAVESTWNDGTYRLLSGTSMATPHVSGLAAKLWQGSAAATRDYLHSRARDIWTIGDDTATGFGLPTL
ncbi:MAG TPA: S8 family peptidase [Candidatus Paceibacterota bacterium]